jgi:hypothetical protein
MSQSALFKTLNLFPPEKTLVNIERAKGSYDVLPYFLSKVLAELPLAALYPLVFSSVVYPMTGLQPSVRVSLVDGPACKQALAQAKQRARMQPSRFRAADDRCSVIIVSVHCACYCALYVPGCCTSLICSLCRCASLPRLLAATL